MSMASRLLRLVRRRPPEDAATQGRKAIAELRSDAAQPRHLTEGSQAPPLDPIGGADND